MTRSRLALACRVFVACGEPQRPCCKSEHQYVEQRIGDVARRISEETPERTRVTVTSAPLGSTTPSEAASFLRERPNMTLGWTGSFDKLEALLERTAATS